MKLRIVLVLTLLIAFISPANAATNTCIAYGIGGVGDRSYNDAVAVAAKRTGVDKTAFAIPGQYEKPIATLIAKGCTSILAVGSEYARAIKVAADANPTISFAIINDGTVQSVNVTSLIFNEREGGYLAGVAAALSSKSGKVAMIASVDEGNDFENGFRAGAAWINPKISVDTKYVSTDYVAAVNALVANGNDIIFYTVPGSVESVFNAIIVANKKSYVGFIGLDPDQFMTINQKNIKYVVATITKHLDVAAIDYIQHTQKGESIKDVLDPKLGIYGYRYGIADKALEITIWSPNLLKFRSKFTAAAIRLRSLKP